MSCTLLDKAYFCPLSKQHASNIVLRQAFSTLSNTEKAIIRDNHVAVLRRFSMAHCRTWSGYLGPPDSSSSTVGLVQDNFIRAGADIPIDSGLQVQALRFLVKSRRPFHIRLRVRQNWASGLFARRMPRASSAQGTPLSDLCFWWDDR